MCFQGVEKGCIGNEWVSLEKNVAVWGGVPWDFHVKNYFNFYCGSVTYVVVFHSTIHFFNSSLDISYRAE